MKMMKELAKNASLTPWNEHHMQFIVALTGACSHAVTGVGGLETRMQFLSTKKLTEIPPPGSPRVVFVPIQRGLLSL